LKSEASKTSHPSEDKRISRATMDENEDAADLEDNDERFLHIMQNSEGADLSRKFFKNTTAPYLM
jgi:hypothetical protein